MKRVTIGLVQGDPPSDAGLAAAAERSTDISARSVSPGDAPLETVAGLIVDAPLEQRGEIVGRLAERWRVPILVEAPFAATLDAAIRVAARLGQTQVFSMNPLRYSLPTMRLLESVARAGEPLHTFFAAWRFQRDGAWGRALPQLLDYTRALCGSRPSRISAMRRERPSALLVSLRYLNDVVGSLEVGAHLPDGSSLPSEFLLECFCRNNVYHCAPGNHIVTVEGRQSRKHYWLPDPAERMVAEFVEALHDGRPSPRGARDDLDLLALCHEILASAEDGRVRSWDSQP